MFARAETHGLQLYLEVAMWALPALLAWRLWWRGRPGARAGWLAIAAICTVISIDKGVDLQMLALPWLQRLAHWIDPEAATNGRDRGVRLGLVAIGALLLAAPLWLLMRLDRQPTGPKVLAAAGLFGVVLYLGARMLLPGLGEVTGWMIEIGCWLLVMVGVLPHPS